MTHLHHVLCPVDLSEFSAHALRHAAALAQWYEADLTALSVHSRFLTPMTPWPTSSVIESEAAAGDQMLRTFVSDTAAPLEPRVVTSDGAVVPEILRVALALPADLIVMGTHGLSGFERLLLGSVTEKVLRKAPCPVLTVPRGATEEVARVVAFKTIVCGIDFSEASTHALDYALSLAQEAAGRLVLVHALEWFDDDQPWLTLNLDVQGLRVNAQQAALEQLDALVPARARTWCDPEFHVVTGKAHRAVLKVASDQNADLIVLGVHGRGALDLAVFGSTSQHVVRAATCPVLTVRNQAKAAGATGREGQ